MSKTKMKTRAKKKASTHITQELNRLLISSLELSSRHPLPLIIHTGSPLDGTYLMAIHPDFDSIDDAKDKHMLIITILNEDEYPVLAAKVGWEDASFYSAHGYTDIEAHQIQCGLLIKQNEDLFSTGVFAHFRKMIAENPIFMDYLKEQYRKSTMSDDEYEADSKKQRANINRVKKKLSDVVLNTQGAQSLT